MLKWKETPEGWHLAYSGELMVGSVLRRSTDGKIVYETTAAVHMRHIAKTHGEVSSFANGKRAVERAWATWLRRALLQPIEIATIEGERAKLKLGHSIPGHR